MEYAKFARQHAYARRNGSKEQMEMLLGDGDEDVQELLDTIDEHVFEVAAAFEARCIL
jgi:hypothetical protein